MQVNILGFGNMGQAIASALIKNKFKGAIFVSDHNKVSPSKVKVDKNFTSLHNAGIVIISVKPQDTAKLAEELKGKIKSDAIVISIAAGVNLTRLEKLFHHKKIVRMMPNLGLVVGQGIAVWKSVGLTGLEKNKAKLFMNKFTENFEVRNEKLIDATTAISGSGPAYFFFLASALKSAAENLGLQALESRKLVEKTLSATSALQSGNDYESLISRIKSKKGTTEAALKVFQKKHFKKIIQQAVAAAYNRAKQLSNG